MTRIVVNKCFGGFGLSPKAIARLAELRGQKAYFFTGGFGGEPRTMTDINDVKGMFWNAYNTPSPMPQPATEEWCDWSIDERIAHNAKTGAETIDDCRDDRSNPLLIQVVEELGEAASGMCGKLEIVEIPDDVNWEIDEYDGMETVREKHRSW
jgi:hypothetical protein